jgi:antitoxin component of MazEF toxin-antitoxin module
MVNMVEIGRSKFGQNNRISLVEGLPDLLNLEIGDYVEFFIENGELIIRKETKKYNGFDFESEEIHEKLLAKERSLFEQLEDENTDPETMEQRAREQYLKDKAERENRKKD